MQNVRGDAFYEQQRRHVEGYAQLQDTNSVVQLMVAYNHLVREGILQAVFYALTLFVGIGCLVTFLFELTSLKDILNQRPITAVFAMLEFMLVFQYRDTVKKVMVRFQRAPRWYFELLRKLSDIAETVSCSVDERWAAKARPDEQTSLNALFLVLCWANFMALPMFSQPHRALPISMPAGLYHEVRNKMKKDISQPIEWVAAMLYIANRLAGDLRNDKVFTASQESQILAQIKQAEDILRQVEADRVLGIPPIIDLITLGVIGLFVLFIIPLQIYSLVDILTPLLYPIIAIVFTSIFLFWIYYNEPFSPFSHYKAMDFAKWRSDNNKRIRNYQYLSLVELGTRLGVVQLDSTDAE